jgi:hypothetical protein
MPSVRNRKLCNNGYIERIRLVFLQVMMSQANFLISNRCSLCCLFVFPCCKTPVFCHCRMVLDPKNSNHNDYGSIQSHSNHSPRHLHHAIDIPGEAHQSCSDDTGLHSDNESVRLTHDMTQSDLYQRQVCISLDVQDVLMTMLTHCTALPDPERTSSLCTN